MEAQIKRNISTSTQYDKYIKRADNKTHLIKADAGIPDTIKLMKSVIQESIPQANALAKELRGKNLYDTCQNVWNFFYQNVQYTRDEKGKEQVRTFNRMYFDRFRGVDCDCYTVSICALLVNLGIESYIRVAAYDEETGFQHVYVVVVDEKQPKGYIVIDPVMENFDAEHPFLAEYNGGSGKQDHKIKATYQQLNGLEQKNTIMRQKNIDAIELNGWDSWSEENPNTSGALTQIGGQLATGLISTLFPQQQQQQAQQQYTPQYIPQYIPQQQSGGGNQEALMQAQIQQQGQLAQDKKDRDAAAFKLEQQRLQDKRDAEQAQIARDIKADNATALAAEQAKKDKEATNKNIMIGVGVAGLLVAIGLGAYILKK